LLRAARRNAGLTQAQLARRLQLGQSFVSKVERGQSYVDVVLLVDWCDACGTSAADIVNALKTKKTTAGPLPRKYVRHPCKKPRGGKF